MKDRRKLTTGIAGSALVLGCAALAWFLLRGGDERRAAAGAAAADESPEARRERCDERREEQAARLRRVLEAGRRNADDERPEEPEPREPIRRRSAGDGPPAPLTGTERKALAAAAETIYSPEGLRQALESGSAGDMVREMHLAYAEAQQDESLGGPAAQEALGRLGLLLDYGLNVAHAQRPAGEAEGQWQMIERINRGFSGRIDALNADYPDLGIRLVER